MTREGRMDPVTLADRCRGEFELRAMSLGEALHRARMVTITELSGTEAVFAVHSSPAGRGEIHEVQVDWSRVGDGERALDVACECAAYVEDGALCEHIWAAILILDARGKWCPVPGTHALDVDTEVLFLGGNGLDVESDPEEHRPIDPHSRFGTASMVAAPDAGRADNPPSTRRWSEALRGIEYALEDGSGRPRWGASRASHSSRPREIWYQCDPALTMRVGRLAIRFHSRETRRDGTFGKTRPLKVAEEDLVLWPPSEDREILTSLIGSQAIHDNESYSWGYGHAGGSSRCLVAEASYETLLPRLCATRRFVLAQDPAKDLPEQDPLKWDDGPPWRFEILIAPDSARDGYRIEGIFRREEKTLPLTRPDLFSRTLYLDGRQLLRIARDDAAWVWIRAFAQRGPILVPSSQRDQMITRLCQMPSLPTLSISPETGWTTIRGEPKPRLSIRFAAPRSQQARLSARLCFDYGEGFRVEAGSDIDPHPRKDRNRGAFIDSGVSQILVRDPDREHDLLERAVDAGFSRSGGGMRPVDQGDLTIAPKSLPRAVRGLVEDGWVVEAEGRRIRQPGAFSITVSSGVDWFELDAKVDFEGMPVPLPELLAALRRGDGFVVLGDGTQGILPEEWLKRYAPLAAMGEVEGNNLRFRPTQAMLLDAMLAAQADVDVDAAFERIRTGLRSFDGILPAPQPPGFIGTLRQYQRIGLGWLHFLQEFGLGGCMADDMGLGKTIQVLALLLERRNRKRGVPGAPSAPSLVVVPRSLIFNWIEEARRFAPEIRILDFTGISRHEHPGAIVDGFSAFDLVLTTYGTLRRDIGRLKEVRFDYAILDEAQAIKNGGSLVAKASRLIRAEHRLALTGTPIENHLGELWSIFEFLNPAMLGSFDRFRAVGPGAAGEVGDENSAVQILARALRPFILRRTKERVLSELPAKTEQTLFCEMGPRQQKLYTDLRDHYRETLSRRIARDGLQKSKIHVLEALLRLRQAACHPGLIDRDLAGQASAKLEALDDQIREVVSEGHKALIFSQFTSLLAIVRKQLDREHIVYEYLDGGTRDRQRRVHRFQEDQDCPLFLISLKAGGHGLNLTAADYVFILDPWWNPAAEAQAIDRSHRIGQTRPVFAYRLITRGTVEEKILELQREKRRLAEAIISEDESLIRGLTAEDLRILLG